MAAPLLIDRDQLVKSVVLAVLVAVLCLIIGFYSGYHIALSERGGSLSFFASAVSAEDGQVTGESPLSAQDDVMATLEDESVTSEETVEPIKVSDVSPAAGKQQVSVDTAATEQEPEAVMEQGKPVVVDTATAEDSRYAIQVGLYGSERNARRRVDELVSQGFSGYLSSFDNDSGKTLYNVRLGHFSDNASAVEALGIFKEHYDGEGYVTRLE